MFDTRLLIHVTALTLLVTACAIALSWFVNRRMRGASYWSMGYFFLAGGVLLQTTQAWLSPYLSILTANLLLAGGLYYTYVGVSLFLGRTTTHRHGLWWLLASVVAIHLGVGLGREGFVARSFLVSTLFCSLALLIAQAFYRSESTGRGIAVRANAVVYLLLALAFALRALGSLFITQQETVVDNTLFSQVTYLLATLFNILIAFSYLLTLYGSHDLTVQRVADTDLLTGLLNRQGVCKHADLLIKRRQARGGGVGAVFFRIATDLQAKSGQDRVLVSFAEKLWRSFQPQDVIGRLGERLFVAVVALGDEPRLDGVASYLQRTFEANGIEWEGQTLHGRVEHVVVEAAMATMGFAEMWHRAERRLEQGAAGLAEATREGSP